MASGQGETTHSMQLANVARPPCSRCTVLTGEARAVRMRRVCRATRLGRGRGAAVRWTPTERRLITGAVIIVAAMAAK